MLVPTPCLTSPSPSPFHLLQLISEHVRAMLAEKSNQSAQASQGAEWKRGWDDWKGASLEKPAGEGEAEGKQ